MRVSTFVLGLTAVALTAPAIAADPAPAKSKEDRIICKVEREVGSNISDRVCKTRAEWREEATNARREKDRWARGTTGSPKSVPGVSN